VRAHMLIALKLSLEEGLATIGAAGPQALGADGLLRVVDDLVIFAFEPTHYGAVLSTGALFIVTIEPEKRVAPRWLME
jgi:hypothetical protein